MCCCCCCFCNSTSFDFDLHPDIYEFYLSVDFNKNEAISTVISAYKDAKTFLCMGTMLTNISSEYICQYTLSL